MMLNMRLNSSEPWWSLMFHHNILKNVVQKKKIKVILQSRCLSSEESVQERTKLQFKKLRSQLVTTVKKPPKQTHTHLQLWSKTERHTKSNEEGNFDLSHWAAESSSRADKNESSENTGWFFSKAVLRLRRALCISSQLNKWLTEGYLQTLAGGHAAARLWFSLTSAAPLITVDESSWARGVMKWSEWRAADSSSKR